MTLGSVFSRAFACWLVCASLLAAGGARAAHGQTPETRYAVEQLAELPTEPPADSSTASPARFAAPQDIEVIRLRPGQLPEVRASGNLLHQVLVAELAAQRGDYATAADILLSLARRVGDLRLARRAIDLYLATRNLDGALRAASQWLHLAPEDDEAQATELALRVASGQTEGLAARLRARIAAAPDKRVALVQARATLAHLDDAAQALAILEAALPEAVRRLPEAHLALASLAQAANDSVRAVAELRQVLARQPGSEEAARRLLEVGMDTEDAVAQVAAIAEAQRFVQQHPNARRVRLMLAHAWSESGQLDKALAELQAMARHAPEDFDLLFMQAQLHYGADQLAAARALLQHYVQVQAQRRAANPEEASDAGLGLNDAWLLLARIAEREGRLEEALALLARVDDESRIHAVRLRQALLTARLGQVDEAVALAQGAGAQDEDEAVNSVLIVAQILRDAGRVDEAIAELVEADADFPDTIALKYDLAMLYERQNNLADFERLLRDIMALEPEHAQAYNALGYLLADRGLRLDEAKALIAQAHALQPEDPYILDSLGWVHYRLGEHETALDYLQRAWAVQRQVEIATHLGEVLWHSGQLEAARGYWRDALELEPENAVLRETLQRLGVRL